MESPTNLDNLLSSQNQDLKMSAINRMLLDWKVFVFGLVFLTLVPVINLQVPILPVSGVTFIIYTVLLWFVTVAVTFMCLHKFLQNSEPLKCNIFKFETHQKESSDIKINAESVKNLASDIDLYFISKWYVYVSKDKEFTAQSTQFLEEIITTLIETQLRVNNPMLFHACLNIYLKHLKEFRRSLKRREKYNVQIEELYRYSHITSTKPYDYFLHQLTVNLLRHFINSELWNSLPCHILVAIIARKLVSYLLTMTSNPDFLNYHILKALISKQDREKLNLDSYARISITQYYDTVDGKKEVATAKLEKQDEKKEPEISSNDKIPVSKDSCENVHEEETSGNNRDEVDTKENIEHKMEELLDKKNTSPEHKPPELRKRSDPVKIHEPKSSSKTWRDQRDLACVSLGQDPLDALQSMEESKTNKGNFWDSPCDATERTFHNIKDLQETTVNNALHKIGDFQDEAAGVVEGLLDFGRAGFRKGLRLTGLQDNIETAKKPPKKKIGKLTRSDSQERLSSVDSAESVWINPLQVDSPNSDQQILLEKPAEMEDSKISKKVDIPFQSIPSIFTDTGSDSPEPEYEDTADLSTSIAKLRSLLQQRSSESSLSTPAVSPLPEEFQIVEAENVSDLDEVEGVMPAFYKFCTKTATGVIHNTFNTIKTALPSNPTEQTTNIWKFKKISDESKTFIRMKKLLSERKEYCTIDDEIDAAYEAIDSLDSAILSPSFVSNLPFEDDLDEFEAKVPITKTLIDIVCELLSDTNTPFLQEPFVKGLILAFGNTIEKISNAKINLFMTHLAENLITIPKISNTETLNMDFEKYIELIMKNIPDATKIIVGKTTLTKAISLFISSLQVQKINKDVLLQVFEIAALKLIEERSQNTPPASA